MLLFLQAADKEEEGRAFEMTCLLFKMTLLLFKLTCLLFNMTCPLPFVITSAVRNDVSAVRNDMAIVPSDQEFDCLLFNTSMSYKMTLVAIPKVRHYI